MDTLALHRRAELPTEATQLLGGGIARVWLIDSTAPLPAGAVREQLGANEAWLASQLNNPTRLEAYRAAHLWTRSLLRRELGMPAGPIDFVRREGGKPDLDGAPGAAAACGALRFNYSHTHGYVACAIARGDDVGVDMEEVVPLEELQDLLKFVLHPHEAREPRAATPESRLDAFFRVWTAKEALLKATGHGLSINLRHIALRPTRSQVLELVTAPRELAPFVGSLIGHGVLPVNGRRYAYAAALLRHDARFEFRHIAAAEPIRSGKKESLECACD